ncbi:DUF427 domain-containing protein [Nocardioides sp. dk4132]|uniref:DUF427 domain-containing protein n=1 Tax=unclassified Nocardioides TaxID=2615069 RepID=UPI001296F75F|nr:MULTISPECIES: DUF427 domain-containing protein [unclassified Nocardioides]MQW77786.1 DUF427 domain-containing protein [Nocardioides sp. dk4132]QGA08183.1 DUF427 domain-containing protein [Nocardioides sp. dk884]
MTVRTEPIDKWVRAYLDDQVVVDSRQPLLFWEDRFPVPGYAFPRHHVRTDVLRPASDEPRGKHPFFGPHGPVSQWYDVVLGDRTVPHAAWVRDDPALADLLILSWQPGVLDRWTEEDETVLMHPRDPHKRVEALASSRHVLVELDGVRLAESSRPVLLLETGLPTRYYLPREDVALDALEPTPTRSICPYKGTTDSYWSLPRHTAATDVAWCYADPLPAVEKIAGRIAFYNERVDLTVDGITQQRPTTPFS